MAVTSKLLKIMIPRLDISFPISRQSQFWFGTKYKPKSNEFLLNSARSGIVMALRTALPNGGKVGVVAYNCDTVFNAVYQAGCMCVFLDVNENFQIQINEEENKNKELDAIVVTNIFGIKNDIESIRKVCPKACIIVDNAHGYGLLSEGDFTVYSINQGKYPALGPGGILEVNNTHYLEGISQIYKKLLDNKSFISQLKVFCEMLAKAFLYHPSIYGWFTIPLKQRVKPKSCMQETIVIAQMPVGVNRMYNAWLNDREHKNRSQKPFMDIVYTQDQKGTIAEYKKQGVEVDVHFRNWPAWAACYGYKKGDCSVAERLLNEVVMAPNYYKR